MLIAHLVACPTYICAWQVWKFAYVDTCVGTGGGGRQVQLAASLPLHDAGVNHGTVVRGCQRQGRRTSGAPVL